MTLLFSEDIPGFLFLSHSHILFLENSLVIERNKMPKVKRGRSDDEDSSDEKNWKRYRVTRACTNCQKAHVSCEQRMSLISSSYVIMEGGGKEGGENEDSGRTFLFGRFAKVHRIFITFPFPLSYYVIFHENECIYIISWNWRSFVVIRPCKRCTEKGIGPTCVDGVQRKRGKKKRTPLEVSEQSNYEHEWYNVQIYFSF